MTMLGGLVINTACQPPRKRPRTTSRSELDTLYAMTLPDFTLRLRPRGFEPTEADIALKHAQQSKAVKNFWIIIAAVVGFLAVVRLLRYAVRLLVSSRPSEVQAGANDEKAQKVSPEAVIPGRTGKASWRRIPAALTSGFRVIAFRVSVPLGVGSASIAKLFFIWSYMATILAFTFVNSEYDVASLRTRG